MDRIGTKRKNVCPVSTPGFFKLAFLFVVLSLSVTGIVFDGFKEAVAGEFPTVARTKEGKVQGLLTNNTLSWKGIPFAKPPVGNLRWKAPENPNRWNDVKQTFQFSEMCTQPEGGSEDCLYLNVWRPDSKEKNLPVYFWIHGSNGSTGSAALPTYDGANLAKKGNLIVVTPNYRLGPLGWFSHPVLRKGGESNALDDSGNYGTLDIIKALQWVKENIKAFGGDPDNVTIGGLSCHSTIVYTLLISPAAKGLFDKAMSQSALFKGGILTNSVEDGDASADKKIDELLEKDGISRAGLKSKQIAEYLRSKKAKDILSLYQERLYDQFLDIADTPVDGTPVEFFINFRDGKVIDQDGFKAFLFGKYNKVPIMLGNTKEELKLYLFPLSWTMPACDYQHMTEYAPEEPFSTDLMAQTLSLHQPDVYVYRFNYGAYKYDTSNNCEPLPGAFNAWPDLRSIDPFFPGNLALLFGAPHSLDIPFFFGNTVFWGLEYFLFNPWYTLNYPGYELLSDSMIAYLAQFARTGDPGNAGGILWNPWKHRWHRKHATAGPRILFDADATNLIIEMSPN
jgi:para-nitrobenzyl esterase